MQEGESRLKGRVILVVDDSLDALEATAYLVEAAYGCRVYTAASGTQALAMIDEVACPDILFADVVMPGMDGVTLAGLATQRLPNLKVVLVTGWADEVESIVDKGYVALLKPYDVAQVQAIFAELLEVPIT